MFCMILANYVANSDSPICTCCYERVTVAANQRRVFVGDQSDSTDSAELNV